MGAARFDWSEWAEVVGKAANLFRSIGMVRGSRGMIVSPNSWEMLACSAGLQLAGSIAVPVNPTLTSVELGQMIADIDPGVVAASASSWAAVAAATESSGRDPAIVMLDDGDHSSSFGTLLDAQSDDHGSPFIGGQMLFTSGTSGRSKAAYHEPSSDPFFASHYIEAFRLRSDDVHLVAGPLYHSAPSAFCSLTLSFGGTVVVMPKFDAAYALELIQTHRVTTTFMAPILLKRILDLPQSLREGFDLTSLRSLIVAGAVCPFELKVRAKEALGDVLFEFYGSTETKAVTFIPPEEQLRRPGSCGRAMPGVEVRVVGDDGKEVPPRAKGEIWVRRAVDTFRGYWGDRQKTDETIRDGWIRTGDIGFNDEDGYLYIVGRKTAVVISGGVNIYPAEVEAALLGHPDVADAAVVGVDDDEWGERVHARVVSRREVTASQLEEFLRERLAPFKIPRSWEFVEDVGRGDDGKVRKRFRS